MTAKKGNGKPPRSPHTAPKLTTAEKRLKTLTLRRAGYTYQRIADTIGISKTRAHQYVRTEMLKLDEAMEEETKILRQLELERLDEMLAGIWNKARAGSLNSIDRVLKIMERRARIAGFETLAKGEGDTGTPTEVYVVREDQFSEEEWSELGKAQLNR